MSASYEPVYYRQRPKETYVICHVPVYKFVRGAYLEKKMAADSTID